MELKGFLEMNPWVGTFDWYELIDGVEGPDIPRAPNYATIQAHVHSTVRKAAWTAAQERLGFVPPGAFKRAWDAGEWGQHMSDYYLAQGERDVSFKRKKDSLLRQNPPLDHPLLALRSMQAG